MYSVSSKSKGILVRRGIVRMWVGTLGLTEVVVLLFIYLGGWIFIFSGEATLDASSWDSVNVPTYFIFSSQY